MDELIVVFIDESLHAPVQAPDVIEQLIGAIDQPIQTVLHNQLLDCMFSVEILLFEINLRNHFNFIINIASLVDLCPATLSRSTQIPNSSQDASPLSHHLLLRRQTVNHPY